MKTTTITYPSHDGSSTVRALLWEPDGVAAALSVAAPAFDAPPRTVHEWHPSRAAHEPRAVVQLVHGMAEHIERYEPFARFLVSQGFAVCANDHVGHGKTAPTSEDLGHIPMHGGKDILLADLHALRLAILARYGCDTPYILFGHSMGSFIVRVYLTRYAPGVRGAVLCGTGQQNPALLWAGKAMTRALSWVRGERYRSALVHRLGAGAYSKAIPHAKTPFDWISADRDVVQAYIDDPACGQLFSLGAYHTLSDFAADAQDLGLAGRILPDIPLLFIGGAEDPVGEHAEGVHRAVAEYRKVGLDVVDEIIYPGARHEILNESVRETVYNDVVLWLEAQGL